MTDVRQLDGTHTPSQVIGSTLEALEDAVNYRDWVMSRAEVHLGQRILEVGGGTGTMTAWLGPERDVVAIEIDEAHAAGYRARFGDDPTRRLVVGSAVDRGTVMEAAARGIDSAMSFNVLEHIADDEAVMRNVFEALPPGGRFFCFVPALPLLYGALDRALGHERRYTRRELRAKAERAGFRVVDCSYFNFAGAFIWFLNAHVLRSRGRLRADAIALYDRFIVPPSRTLERRWRPPFGQSLALVAEKPG